MTRLGRYRQALGSSLARRLIVATIVFSSAVTLVLTSLQLYGEYRDEVEGLEAELRQVEQVHLKPLAQSLWATNMKEVTLQLEGLTQVPNLEYAAVHEGERLWASAGERAATRFIERSYPVVYLHDGKPREIGVLTVVAGLDGVYRRILRRALVILLSNGLKTFLVAGFGFALFHWLVNRHLRAITTYLRGLEGAGPAAPLRFVRPPRAAPDELDDLASAIDHMQERTQAALQSLRQSERRYRTIVETEPACIKLVDAHGKLIEMNAAGLAMIEAGSLEQVAGKPLSSLLAPEHREAFRAFLADVLEGNKGTLAFEIQGLKGTRRWLETHAVPMTMGSGETVLLGITRDITERKRTEEQLSYLAHYDDLTGLPNRALFHDRLQRAMIDAERHELLVAVLFLDLDRFKNVNDTLGHDAGDQLLKGVTERLLSAVRRGDTVARWSGDEFTIVLAGMGHVDDASRVAQKILDVFTLPFRIDGRDLFIGASVGITLFPFDTQDAGELLRNADIAMYRAKEAGRNGYQFYAAEMTTNATEAMALEGELRRGLERGEFLLHYQPIVDGAGNILGAEALLRWRHAQRGLVSPAQFIPLAEETGLIVPIGDWVLRQACAQARAWRGPGNASFRIAVNVSPRQFRHRGLAHGIEEILRETGLDPRALEIEITESVLMQDEALTQELLGRLGALGVSFSIDDFGTGYSSLSYLKRFAADHLKIDQSFIRDLSADPGDAALVKAIIGMAHSLGIRTVAEGVETPAQRAFLLEHGCDAMQGFYFCRPSPPEAFAALLAAGKPLPATAATPPIDETPGSR